MCRVMILQFPGHRITKSIGSPISLKFNATNFLYNVQKLRIIDIHNGNKTRDCSMRIEWIKTGNVNDITLNNHIHPYEPQVIDYLNNIMNSTWKATHDVERRLKFMQDEFQVLTSESNQTEQEDDDDIAVLSEQEDQDGDISMVDVQPINVPDLEPLPKNYRHWSRKHY